MKITVETKSFVEAIGWATKSMNTKDQKPFVVLERTENGDGALYHMNQLSYMRAPFAVSTLHDDDVRSIPVNGQFLSNMIQALKHVGNEITLELRTQGHQKTVIVTTDRGKFQIPVHNARLPATPEVTTLGSVSDNEYFDFMQRLTKLCDANNEGYYPAVGAIDVSLNTDEHVLTMMATDHYALGEATIDFTPNTAASPELYAQHFLIPRDNSSLITATKGSTESIDIVYDHDTHKFGYRFTDGREALFVLKDANPMSYQKIKTSSQELMHYEVTVSKEELQKCISIVSSLAGTEGGVLWTIDNSQFTVHDYHGENEIEVTMNNAEFDGEHHLKFMYEIVVEAMAPISTKDVKIKWGDRSAPIILVPVLNNGEESDRVFVFASTRD